jgi:hypothetical protein
MTSSVLDLLRAPQGPLKHWSYAVVAVDLAARRIHAAARSEGLRALALLAGVVASCEPASA